MGASFVVELAV